MDIEATKVELLNKVQQLRAELNCSMVLCEVVLINNRPLKKVNKLTFKKHNRVF
jgi:hypothetical protein